MRTTVVSNATAGAMLAVLVFLLVFPAIPVRAASTSNALFTMTVLAPTSNPVRRQYSAIISQSFQSVGIGVNLVYVSFSVLIDRLFPTSCPCTPSYSGGGFDVAFIGHGGGAPLPDFRLLTGYHSEEGAPLANYPTYKNTTVDNLIDKYQTDFNVTDRNAIGQQIVRMVHQDEPFSVIYYSADQYGFKTGIQPWKQTASYTTSELPDVEHWVLASGNTANIAVTGDLDNVNYLPSSASNTIYDLWMYGDVLSGLEALYLPQYNQGNPAYYKVLANSIVPNADHTNYTITFKNNVWQDGVSVTSDDFLFDMQASLLNAGTSVNEGTYQSILGLGTSFTWLNGTTNYTFNGTYYGSLSAVPNGAASITSAYHATGLNAFSFSIPSAYIFTDPILTGISPFPKHILEQFPVANWDTMFGALSDTSPHLISWNANPSEGLTAGSYSAINYLVGNGPYMWQGYDATSQTATLVQNPKFWNLTGLQSAGYFQATTYHVVHIVDKSAAISAFATGQVNVLDTNYQFTSADKATIANDGGYTTFNAGPGAGSQELGYNMGSPIWGTGTATPNGVKDPANAAAYARDVRQAFSHLIPRQSIITNLLLGAGAPGVDEMPNSFGFLYPSDVTAYSYDPATAISLLEAAGYGNAGSSIGGFTGTPFTPVTVGNISLSVPTFVVGQSFTFQGQFAVNTVAGAAGNGFAAILMSSTDNQTWTPTAMFQTNSGGGYSYTYAFTTAGSQSYKVFLTGIPWTYVTTNGIGDPSGATLFHEWQTTTNGHQFLNTTNPIYTSQVNFKVGTLADVITSLAQGVGTGLNTLSTGITANLNTLQSNVGNSLNGINTKLGTLATADDLNNTNSQLTTISYIAYAAIALAIILGLVAIFLARRKPS